MPVPLNDAHLSQDHLKFRNEPLRWYLALLLFALSFIMGFIWNMFNAFFSVSEKLLGISDQSIAYDVMIGSAVLVISAPLMAEIMNSGRFRLAMLFSSFCLCLGSWVILVGIIWSNELIIFFGLIMNGLAGPMAMFGGAALSDLWFPPQQRTQATSLLCLANYLGVGFSFFLGALIVPEQTEIKDASNLSFSIAIISSLILLCTVVHFPSAPRKAVSCSQSVRQQFKPTSTISLYGSLLADVSFLRICACYGLGSGLFAGWGGSLNENLVSFGMNESNSGWIGMMSLLGGFVGGTIGSILVDLRQCSLQIMALALFCISSVSCGLFIFCCFAKCSLALMMMVATLIGAGINGTIPILFELALETTFPIPNAAIGNVLTASNGLGAVIFLTVPIKSYGAMWMNWILFFACILCIPILSMRRIRCKRSEYDSQSYLAPLLDRKQAESSP